VDKQIYNCFKKKKAVINTMPKKTAPPKVEEQSSDEESSSNVADEDSEVSVASDSGDEESVNDEDESSGDEEAPPKAKAAPKTKAVAKAKKPSVKEEADDGKRHFKIVPESIRSLENSSPVDVDKLSSKGGRFSGSSPMQAAKKAFTRIAHANGDENGEGKYAFSITETTRGQGGKSFPYVGHRSKRDKPTMIEKAGRQIEIKYDTVVKSHKTSDTPAEEPKNRSKAVRGQRQPEPPAKKPAPPATAVAPAPVTKPSSKKATAKPVPAPKVDAKVTLKPTPKPSSKPVAEKAATEAPQKKAVAKPVAKPVAKQPVPKKNKK
jgi:hypothetical protein